MCACSMYGLTCPLFTCGSSSYSVSYQLSRIEHYALPPGSLADPRPLQMQLAHLQQQDRSDIVFVDLVWGRIRSGSRACSIS